MSRRIKYTEDSGNYASIEITEEVDGILISVSDSQDVLLGSAKLKEDDMRELIRDLDRLLERVWKRNNPDKPF
jgi:flagellar motor protein MotB